METFETTTTAPAAAAATTTTTQEEQSNKESTHDNETSSTNENENATLPLLMTRTTSTTTTTTVTNEGADTDDELHSIIDEEQPTINNTNNNTITTTKKSLAYSPKTPRLAKLLIPLVCLLTHVLFYYGQTLPMWKLKYSAHIDVWANATDLKSKLAFDALGLDHNTPITINEDHVIQSFTYRYAIEHLWYAIGLPNKFLSQFSAILLIFFSGVWPHFKLLLLNCTWFLSRDGKRRTRTFHWLNALGKWSLADVLVVCVMVGVLKLDWPIVPSKIQQGVIHELPVLIPLVKSQYSANDVCDAALHMHCSKQKRVDNVFKCKACTSLIKEAYARPEWAKSTGKYILNGVDTSGDGLVTLRVIGTNGIYIFCTAVIFSILLSVTVDTIDHCTQNNNNNTDDDDEQQQQQQHSLELTPIEEEMEAPPPPQDQPLDTNTAIEPLLNDNNDSTSSSSTAHRTNTPFEAFEIDGTSMNCLRQLHSTSNDKQYNNSGVASILWIVVTAVTAVVIYHGISLPTMERGVSGAGPLLLQQVFGVNWNTNYSLLSLMQTTGAAKSWDYLLMATFGLFCVVGPLCKSSLLLLLSLVITNCCLQRQQRSTITTILTNIINGIGSFCSWEVLVIAIVMVQLQMPSITDTIYKNPLCATVFDEGSCFTMEFNILGKTFYPTILGGGLVLAFVSYNITNRTENSSTTTTTTTTSHDDYQLLLQVQEEEQDEGIQTVALERN